MGHDWGALVAWDLALRNPEVVDRLGVVNVPHPWVFRRTMLTNLAQFRKSWYVFFFQLPRLPEWSARRDGFRLWVDALRDGSNPGTFSETDLERYRRAWNRERAPTAMINWYRAMVRHRDDPPRDRVAAPTLVVWGENDQALIPEMAPRSLDYCDDGRLERFADATHWIVHEHPDRITDLLVSHLSRQ